MITKEDIDLYVEKVPALPESIKKCIQSLRKDDLVAAAKYAQEDLALANYLITIVNKASYGFREKVTNVSQIFGVLGVGKARSLLTSYLVSLLIPSKWSVYGITNKEFQEFQTNMIENWDRILDYLNEPEKFRSAAVLLPAAIIVSEELFKIHKKDIDILKTSSNLTYNTILYKLTGLSLFDIALLVGEKWDMGDEVISVVKEAESAINNTDDKYSDMAKFLHLLVFFELSKKNMIAAGLNDVLDFDIDYVEDIHDVFIDIIGEE